MSRGCRCSSRDRDGWRFRALFSNTALAHRLGKTERLGRDRVPRWL